MRPNRILAVIPARLESTRLPRKVLREIAGKPLLAWVVEAALRVPQLDGVIVAVDSAEVADLCQQRGWQYQMTSRELASGTDRMHAVAEALEKTHPADIYVNIQGDEPTLTEHHIEALLRPFDLGDHVQATTICVLCTPENITNPNAIKVVTAPDGRALYFSRAAIPYDRENSGDVQYWKHIGLYAYRAATLKRFATLPPSTLEQIERLEQLRLLENNIALYVETVDHDTIGVDTEEDLQRVATLLA
ncbi:3-deoxy-manno-octulosonate cytidylyltransferase [Terriglobus saanensis]|uniref:3-deoxy-manno-octulosonate cytidylyltransferase n=1 Tax=Terriglobus saanensis (strain ATCC BAA-1853 / DSM 23119 / SP1PR4) TaxID=401053 RepID=E8V5K2_TERSS|nr:3-deoxy-manno-octulosonate cytidylyltransferase [Terriglobus saanensis]ADV81536.1 3-deoxy-D-manno-octulosonate cytidylyltransferase [Terriglobus saanensis SP1PR4]